MMKLQDLIDLAIMRGSWEAMNGKPMRTNSPFRRVNEAYRAAYNSMQQGQGESLLNQRPSDRAHTNKRRK